MKNVKKNCTMNVYNIEGMENLIPPSFAQNKRISIGEDFTEDSQTFLSLFVLSSKSLNHLILPYFNEDIVDDNNENSENNNHKNIQNKPVRQFSTNAPFPISNKVEISLSGNLQSLICIFFYFLNIFTLFN